MFLRDNRWRTPVLALTAQLAANEPSAPAARLRFAAPPPKEERDPGTRGSVAACVSDSRSSLHYRRPTGS
ncbi:hypothetical protein F7725_023348 [Dissostichus mawsoni]|uniref:Uncharacterized protein n=1 Tax=Dissostichus mawsoni TaxID=36200 RepID=A0A7J5Z1G1_DISMA|nr:hypothetical protein F7725_023348 [Dissostichus mawsoni]